MMQLKSTQLKSTLSSPRAFMLVLGLLSSLPLAWLPGTIALAQDSMTLLPPAATDQRPGELTGATQLRSLAGTSTEEVHFSWPLDPSKALAATVQPAVSRSREYTVQASAQQLRSGFPLWTTAVGAVVRLSPVGGSPAGRGRAALEPTQLVLISDRGETFAQGTGMDQLASAEALRASQAPFPEGSTAFRIKAELGFGELRLQAIDAETSYLVHVLDHGSQVELALSSQRNEYLAGETIVVDAALESAGEPRRIAELAGLLVSPDGQTWPLSFEPKAAGGHRAELGLTNVEQQRRPGLWEVQVRAEQPEGKILRTAQASFNISLATARLQGGARRLATTEAKQGMEIAFAVEAAVAGRYELRGVLYGTDSRGELRPVGVAHSANWIEAGTGELMLRFGRQIVGSTGMSAPYELRDLQLLDQGRMGQLERRSRALVIQP